MKTRKRILITGGTGFIGSRLVELLSQDNDIIVLDKILRNLCNKPNIKYIKVDLFTDNINHFFEDVDIAFHLAAETDIQTSDRHTKDYIDQNIIVTYRVLEAARSNKVDKFIFPSSTTIYGEAPVPTPENFGPLMPLSLYGGSKLACEAIVSSYCYTFDIQGIIYRLANIVGPRMDHGVIFDFIKKLRTNPLKIEILGDGNQAKSFIYVDSCIHAMIAGLHATSQISIFNIGSEDQITVKRIAEIVSSQMKLNPDFSFTGGERGWKVDVPKGGLSIEKIKRLGWKPDFNSEQSVCRAVQELLISINKDNVLSKR